jgi:CHASE2 domain-containing sensor protein
VGDGATQPLEPPETKPFPVARVGIAGNDGDWAGSGGPFIRVFLRFRPAEPEDDRIVLVGIDETDTDKIGYPIPEAELVDLLNTLQTHQPRVIGLHISQNQIDRVANGNFFTGLKQRQNLVVAERLLPASDQIPPLKGFSGKQVGFIDVIPDGDLHLRHMILGTLDPIDLKTYKLSLAIRLVEAYLVSRDSSLSLANGIRDPDAIRFGTTELPRLEPDSGGYVRAPMGDPEILLNFRTGTNPFRLLSLNQIKTGNFDPEWLRDRIVIVGITDPKIRPIIPTATTSDTNSLEIQAHTVSQIISAVLDGRLLFSTWPGGWEYLWIVIWGGIGVALGRQIQWLMQTLLAIGVANLLLVGMGYLLLTFGGLWLPVVPALLALNLSVVFPAVYEYVYEQEKALKTRLDERQRTLEQTFNTIHNGPLQTLASLLRRMRDSYLSQEQVFSALENLNREIRGISDHLKQETLVQEDSLYLGSGIKIDLKLPIHELFYEVYSYTLERPDFSRFETLKVACQFEPVEQHLLTIDQKRGLCRFLEEALCNVGKHAEGATQLSITGTHHKDWYRLQVVDNGTGIQPSTEGEGTKNARRLAAQLKGKFKRIPVSPQGMLCELTFPLVQSWFW